MVKGKKVKITLSNMEIVREFERGKRGSMEGWKSHFDLVEGGEGK